MQYSKLHQQTLRPFEQILLKSETQYWQSRLSQLINHIITPIVFATDNQLVELDNYALIPALKLSSLSADKQNIASTVPILRGKIFQWNFTIKRPTPEIFIKLGTGNRTNHCQVKLAIFAQDSLVATAKLDGTTVQDNQYNQFILDNPLLPNQYTCQLESPDADNAINTLFLWLEIKYENKQGLANYCYSLPTNLPMPTKSILISIIILQKENLQTESNLQNCLASVVNQAYPHWELLVNGEKQANIDYPKATKFIPKLVDIFNFITGEYVIIMPSTDLLTEDALLEVSNWLNDEVDMLYSDEDKFNNEGLFFDEPYFKPDYSVEMLRSQPYTGQLAVYKTSILKQMEFNGDLWELALQFAKHRIQHIPKILYHSYRSEINPSLQTTQAALDREGYGGIAKKIDNNNIISYPVTGKPLVSIIIPTRDMAKILNRCIESILTISTYPNWEIIVVDNGSQEPETLQLLEKYQTTCRILQYDIPFNFAKLVNYGVEQAQGEIILLLNNDTEVIEPVAWLQEMIGFAQHPEIAVVGCKLLYPQDNTIQHAGLICGIGGIANHSHKYFPVESGGYYNRLAIVTNYSAVTGACLMVERDLWGTGFDENLSVAFNDVDFCLRLLHQGFRHVVLPQVKLYHHESQTRGLENNIAKQARLHQEEKYMQQRWGNILQNDPFYNLNLTKASEDFTISHDSRYFCI